ncbi:patatin-like phospholipase family protein [Olivibacter sp. SDN3]|uniref:patatin-like phospholipase family protein n=1 Tax=Olivibacter sp. SDN3 TaxID=2764720 RepID=UPI0016512DB0|nr:patatin-like phospholipase family protein [Olivibacter sp. SDN3]QNL49605.1 patatin-like phospholipase family protein [Olivibacter sp. SDN3]
MKTPISLVLSSGGARGITHIGAIRALEEQGFSIKSIAGSSIGSLIGGIYAMDKLDVFTIWLKTLKRRDVFNLMDFTWSAGGVMKGEKVFNKIKTFIPDVLIEQMEIPFVAVSTDILHQKEIVFKSGSFFDAVRASISIPGVFTPVNHLDYTLVDGGLINPLPLNHIEPTTENPVIAINLNAPEDESLAPPKIANKHNGYFTITQKAILTMLGRITELSIKLHRPDIVVHIPRNVAGIWDYHKADYLIELGYTKTLETLLANKTTIPFIQQGPQHKF